jgi:copper chaperone CopZ
MNPPDSAEAGLHEFVDAEIDVQGLDDPVKEKALSAALGKIAGVQSVRISADRVAITYEPVSVTKAELIEVIGREGLQVGEVETGLASPVADACEIPVESGGTVSSAGE